MSELSALRNTQGFWQPSPELQNILLSKASSANKSTDDTTAEKLSDNSQDGGAHQDGSDARTASDSCHRKVDSDDALEIVTKGRPKAIVDNSVWFTVLVLAFLSLHCASEQQLWKDMESKAVKWLRSTPWGASNSVAAAVAQARKSIR